MGSNGSSSRPRKPLIGLTAYGERAAFGVWDLAAVLLPRTYTDQIVAAGALPVLLPPLVESADAVERLDAVVLTGGPDVAPHRYGADPLPTTGAPRPERDAAELAVLARALELGKPVLAVCRGMQILNTGLGGTLEQHVPDVVGHTGHNPAPGVFGTTTITLDPDTVVGTALGPAVAGRCHHHQAISRLAEGLVVTGRAGDGTIEAVEHSGTTFVVGVQWHPEQDDPRLFTALAAAASPSRTRETA
ncbi:gamma-glutamyl-gamma-aminobutyrate hydrolase family protein [Pseudonocardia sp. GCM10023141]|uniref:gamma-glutamyl-gamma-aminobutyrate hydrolase family protein n=1 Tax=Pseudonocardia sp. GCM10023141 TaxID=3252653 RepID=UPI00360F2701